MANETNSHPESLDAMLDAWNESDSDRVRKHLDKALAPDVVFIDPSISLTGIDAFEANVHEVQRRILGAVYTRTTVVDSHNHLYRYGWAISQGGRVILPGFDVTETNEDGLVTRVLGFFGVLADLE